MKHIFISYSRADSDLVGLIENDLQESGHEIWRDTESIQSGEEWSISIEEGLENAYVLLVVLSTESLQSEWVRREYEFVLDSSRAIPNYSSNA